MALVGESGSGKTLSALSMLCLVPEPGRIVSGEILFQGRDILHLGPRELQALRGNEISMVFQEPMTSLNPVHRVGDQIAEVIRLHRGLGRRDAAREATRLLGEVGIADPGRRAREYPHRFSGGMSQRAMIAMALACRPKLLIADEPTTALDTTVQAQILDLIRAEAKAAGSAVLLITHDLGIVSGMADRVVVLYAGSVVESGPTAEVFSDPRHPYTRGLLDSLPGASRGQARRDPRPGSGARYASGGLPLRAAMPVRGAALLDRAPASRRTRGRPPGRMLGRVARTDGAPP